MGSSVILPTPGQPATGPDSTFKTAATPNIVTFGFDKIDPPSSLYIQRDDVLVLEAASSLALETVNFFFRLLQPYAKNPGQPDTAAAADGTQGPIAGPGYIQFGGGQIAILAADTTVQVVLPQMEGYLLSVTAVANQALIRGITFVRAWLNRGPVSSSVPTAVPVLFADYATKLHPIGWPYGRVVSPAEGPGAIVSYSPIAPAAGADFSFTTALPGRVRLQTLRAQLVTSATVANRVPSFRLNNQVGGTPQFTVQATAPIAASTTVVFSLAPGGTNVTGAGAIATEVDITLPVPSPFFATRGLTVSSSTQGLQAGDQWSLIGVTTEEWLDLF